MKEVMHTVKTNEREFMSQVISWVNEWLNRGNYPFEVASCDPSIKLSEKETRFPDVQIWLNRLAGLGFCGWELKTQAAPVDDSELLEKAAEKSRAMHADYFVTWNMRDTIIWRTPKQRVKVTKQYRYHSFTPIYQITRPDDIWVEPNKELLRQRAKELLDSLATLYREGHLYLIETDTTFFVHHLTEVVISLSPFIHESLKDKVGSDPIFREGLFDWAVAQGIPRYGDESFYEMVSRQVIYRLLGRIIFYQALLRQRSELEKMDFSDLRPDRIMSKLKEYFGQARQIDYQAVFEEDYLDEVPVPPVAAVKLAELVEDLNRFNFASMPQDVIGAVFERLIPYEERYLLGQYFTPEDLVDFITAFCVRGKDDFILDPTCGTGTFLLRAYDRKKILGEREHQKLLSQLWGVDIAHFPAELATINLYKQNLADYSNFPRIVTKDFFKVRPRDVLEFVPPKRAEDAHFMIKEEIPVFDAAVGNFPYIRQELINRRIAGYKKSLEQVIANDWLQEYPAGFDMPKKVQAEFKKTSEHGLDVSPFYNKAQLKLSGQADIYAYLFFHVTPFVRQDGGRLGFVTSNAWLDVEYGYELQKFFLDNFKIIAILESRCEPWFVESAVNTIVTILERCADELERKNHLVKFVKVKRPLKELIPWDMKIEAMNRWADLDRIVHHIEHAGSEFMRIKDEKSVNALQGVKTYEDENFRIRVKRQGELLEEITQTGRTAKWGVYLRAPEVYFEILEKCRESLVPLEKVAELRRGVTTGINEFFYLTDDRIKHWGIEDEFLVPVVTSAKEVEGITIDPQDVEYKVFLCHKSKEELLRDGQSGVRRYIEYGEKQRTKERGRHKKGGIPFPQVPSVKNRAKWYDIGSREPGDFIVNRFVDERFYFPVNKDKILVGDVVFEGKFFDQNKAWMNSALMNSAITFLFVETIGRVNLGDGLLTCYGPEISQVMVPSVEAVSPSLKEKLLEAFTKLSKRSVKPIFEEVKMKDRQKFDKLVLQSIGINPENYLKPIYKGLTELVKERKQLAQMRQKVQKARVERDIEKLKRDVMEELLPTGPKRFPEEFLTPSIKRGQFNEITVPADKLKLGDYFMGFQEVVSNSGFRYEAKSVEEAKFIIYAQKPDSFLVKIPKNSVAISKAVWSYERYLRTLTNKLFQTFYERTFDYEMTDRLTRRIWDELNLPEIA